MMAPGATSAIDLLAVEQNLPRITTGCTELDGLVEGGVSLGKIVELFGVPGIGKTQLGLQLAVNVQLPRDQGGADGEAIFIDTEGSFVVERAMEMAAAAGSLGVDTILAGIHVYRVHDYLELLSLVHLLEDVVRLQRPRVRLVVIDSIAFHFRYDFSDMSLRTRLLNIISNLLVRLASSANVAIILLNQMTTKFGGHDANNTAVTNQGSSGGSGQLVPALGESWGRACNTRLLLYWQNNTRHAKPVKSSHQSTKTVPVPFQITQNGVRSVPAASLPNSNEASSPSISSASSSSINSNASLKRRYDHV